MSPIVHHAAQDIHETIDEINEKIHNIWSVLEQPDIDLWKLRELCLTKGGLINDEIRRKAWPILVGLYSNSAYNSTYLKPTKQTVKREIREKIDVVDPSRVKPGGLSNQIMAKSLDAEQIDRDTARCTWHLLTGSQRSRGRQMRNKHRKKISNLLKRKQCRLANLINLTLIQSYQGVMDDEDKLRYFQGYHDVASIFLSALGGISSAFSLDSNRSEICFTIAAATKTAEAMGLDLPCQVLLKVSRSHFRDAMRPNFQLLTAALRLTIMPLLSVLDPYVHSHLAECQMEPFFALSWIITWFSHDVRDTTSVKRLFDVFIASHPLMPIYMAIAMVLHPVNRDEILRTDCDFACLHTALSQLPRNSCLTGWKYIRTSDDGEYVSGDDDDDEDIASFETDETKSFEDHIIAGDDDSFAPSLASSSLWSSPGSVPVSFEEIIELAIHFMRRIPPRKLITLSRTYIFDKNLKALIAETSAIALLQPAPVWAVADSAPSWYQKRLDGAARSQSSIRSRRKRKTRSLSSHGATANTSDNLGSDVVDESVTKKTQEAKSLCAIIAAGIGPDGDGDRDKARRIRRLIWAGAGISILALIFWHFSVSFSSSSESSVTQVNNNQSDEKITIMENDTDLYTTESYESNLIDSTSDASSSDLRRRSEVSHNDTCPLYFWDNNFRHEMRKSSDNDAAIVHVDAPLIQNEHLTAKSDVAKLDKSPVNNIAQIMMKRIRPVRMLLAFGKAAKHALLEESENFTL